MEFESWYSGDEAYLQIDVNQTATPMPRLVVSLSFNSIPIHVSQSPSQPVGCRRSCWISSTRVVLQFRILVDHRGIDCTQANAPLTQLSSQPLTLTAELTSDGALLRLPRLPFSVALLSVSCLHCVCRSAEFSAMCVHLTEPLSDCLLVSFVLSLLLCGCAPYSLRAPVRGGRRSHLHVADRRSQAHGNPGLSHRDLDLNSLADTCRHAFASVSGSNLPPARDRFEPCTRALMRDASRVTQVPFFDCPQPPNEEFAPVHLLSQHIAASHGHDGARKGGLRAHLASRAASVATEGERKVGPTSLASWFACVVLLPVSLEIDCSG